MPEMHATFNDNFFKPWSEDRKAWATALEQQDFTDVKVDPLGPDQDGAQRCAPDSYPLEQDMVAKMSDNLTAGDQIAFEQQLSTMQAARVARIGQVLSISQMLKAAKPAWRSKHQEDLTNLVSQQIAGLRRTQSQTSGATNGA